MSESTHHEHRKLAAAEAAAFAQVIAAGGPASPASIALFGESSSSKSLFIDRLVSTMNRLTQGEPAPGQGRFVTVRFSALPSEHGQLWAHFVEHLFAELQIGSASAETSSEADPLAAQLMGVFKLDDQAKRVLRARERVARAEASMERAREAYEKIYGKPVRSAERVSAEVTSEIFADRMKKDKAKLLHFARDLGVRTVNEDVLTLLMADASTRVGRTRMLASALISIVKRRPLVFVITTLLAIVATAAATFSFDTMGVDFLARFMPEALARPLGDATIALTAAVLAFRLGLFGPARAIAYLRHLDKHIRTTVESETGREQVKSSAKATVLAKRETGVGNARQVLTDAERELNDARAELAAATPGGNPNGEPPARPPRPAKLSRAEEAEQAAAALVAEEYAKAAAQAEAGAEGLPQGSAPEAGTDDAAAAAASAAAEAGAPAEPDKPLAPVGRVVVIFDGLDRCGNSALADALRAFDAMMTLPQFTVIATLDQERINKTLRREDEKRAIEQEDELGQQRRAADDFTPGAGATAMSDEYLCGRFDTFYWVRDEVEPDLAHNSASVGAHLAELASDNDEEWWSAIGGSGETEFSAAAIEEIALSPAERKLIQRLDVMANQSAGGGQRLIHAYYLIKTALGPASVEGFIGAEGNRPHYRAMLAQLGFICGMPRLFERYVAVQSMSARRGEDMHGLIMRLRRLHFDRIRGGGRYMEVLQMLEELDPGKAMVHALALHANTAARFSLCSPDLVPLFEPPRKQGERDEHSRSALHA
jgi:KAP family P-loop domain